MFPKLGTERIAMSRIGDVLAAALFKLGNGEPLSKQELEVIRLQGNLTDANNAFVGGLQSGTSDINVGGVNAQYGNFRVPPNSAAFFGSDWFATGWPQTIPDSTGTQLTTVFEDSLFDSNSVVIWHDAANYRMRINPRYSQATTRNVRILGNYNSPTTAGRRQVLIQWFRISDNSEYKTTTVILSPTTAGGFIMELQLNDFDEDPTTMYIQLRFWQDTGGDLGIQFYCTFERTI